MRTNKKRKMWRLHASKKSTNPDAGEAGRPLVKFAALAAVVATVAYAGYKACEKLGETLRAQCVVENAMDTEAIKISTTPHISEALVRELFSLTNGCNLATLDIAERREEILREQPLIRALTVTRRLPDRLEISAEERTPVARVNCAEDVFRTSRGDTVRRPRWDVADAEGVVFKFKLADSALLPRVIWGARAAAKPGERLSGRAMSAVRLAEINAAKDFANFRLDKVDVSNNTYLVAYFFATTEACNMLKIDWNFVDDPSSAAQPHMRQALGEIMKICASRLDGPLGTTFTVNEEGRLTAKYSE